MNKEELLLVSSSSISGVAWGANTIVVPIYLTQLGLPPFYVGLLLSASIVFSSSLAFAFSILADAHGRKRYALISRLVSAVSFLFLFMKIPYAYIFSSSWGGGGLVNAMLAEKTRNVEGDLSLMNSLSIVSSFIGALLPLGVPIRFIFLVDSGIAFTSLLLISMVSENYKGSGHTSFKVDITMGKFSTEAVIGLGAGIVIPLMSLWFELRFNESARDMSPVFALSDLTLALTVLAAPRLAARVGTVKAIVLTHVSAIALLIALPFSPTFPAASAIFVVRNALMNMGNPLLSSMILKLMPENRRASATSFINLLSSIPRAAGPSIGGYLFGEGNLYSPFFITAGLYSLATALFYAFFRNARLEAVRV
ncbi:MFS transporter [Thermocladium modestius]|uniref:MFS transporter n=1 Tax=Thermocladium modestius TaxID=62609 RepID=A0A830GTB0_9CREN|nr:MFS transporter [Thermocladium modestius]GGP20298.1 MFS transporter [Thermocladium modestius]